MKSLVSPVSILASVTVTPGTPAPLESETVPRISPELVLCAKDRLPANARKHTASVKRITVLMEILQVRSKNLAHLIWSDPILDLEYPFAFVNCKGTY